MDDLASRGLPDGLVLIPSAGGYTAAELMEQQKLVNRQRATALEEGKVQNLTVHGGVRRVNATVRGLLEDWNNGADHSLRRLFMTDNRLQGLGLLLAALALGGLLIDGVLRG